MKTKLKLLTASLLAGGLLMTSAAASSYDACADALKEMNLFLGTGSGYELDRAPTRAEAAVMLVRLLGQEDAAWAGSYSLPFTDLQDWEKPYVGWLYQNGLTNGTSATLYSPEASCTAQMYATFLLRALGYSDAAGGDFSYSFALDYAESKGVINDAIYQEGETFLRDDVVAASYTALSVAPKSSGAVDLLTQLVNTNAVDATAAAPYQKRFADYRSYAAKVDALARQSLLSQSSTVKMAITSGGNAYIDLDAESSSQYDQTARRLSSTQNFTMTAPSLAPFTTVSNLYYADGTAYFDTDGTKYSAAANFSELFADQSFTLICDPVCLLDDITVSGDTYTLTYSGAGLTAGGRLLDFTASLLGRSAATFQKSTIEKMTYVQNFDTNGKPSTINATLDFTTQLNGETVRVQSTLTSTVDAVGSAVTINTPSDLSAYPKTN